jgi:protein-S-isoprenylcysteine O-methyltransferase Ste14
MLARAFALLAMLPAGATLYFFVFWRGFDFWRRHRVATYVMMFGTFFVLGVAAYLARQTVFAWRFHPTTAHLVLGWLILGESWALGLVADRQLGLRIRSFTPFFEENARIALRTTGAYAIVRHPIYASGIGFQLGALLVTGYLAILPAWIVFTLGAVWFTRQEERRLVTLLDDPTAYDRYRARVPALLPWPRPRG